MTHLPTGRVHDHVAVDAGEDVGAAAGERGVRLLERLEHPHLDAEAQQRVPLLDVVRLVEDEGVRPVEVPEPQGSAHQGDETGAEPPPQPVRRAGPEQAQAQLLGPGHRVILGAPLAPPGLGRRVRGSGHERRRPRAGSDPHRRPPRRRAEAGRRAARRRRRRRRGHPQAAPALPGPRRQPHRAGGVVPRAQRGRAHPRARRPPPPGRPGARRDGCRDAVGLGPRVPSRQRRGGHRRAGHRGARPVGGAHVAGGLRPAGRPVLLRGLPPAPGWRAGDGARRPGRRTADDGVLRGPPPAGPHARPRWARPSAPTAGRRCAAS